MWLAYNILPLADTDSNTSVSKTSIVLSIYCTIWKDRDPARKKTTNPTVRCFAHVVSRSPRPSPGSFSQNLPTGNGVDEKIDKTNAISSLWIEHVRLNLLTILSKVDMYLTVVLCYYLAGTYRTLLEMMVVSSIVGSAALLLKNKSKH
jgi:hypothetical protein